MNKRLVYLYLVFVLLIGLAGCSGAAQAAGKAGSVEVHDPWVRSAKSGGNTAAYMLLKNTGDQPDKLVKAEYEGAGMVELMITAMSGDKMEMQTVMELEVPAKSELELKPGGNHVMLMNLKQDVLEGETAKVTLTFASGSTVTLDMPIKPRPAE